MSPTCSSTPLFIKPPNVGSVPDILPLSSSSVANILIVGGVNGDFLITVISSNSAYFGCTADDLDSTTSNPPPANDPSALLDTNLV